MQRKPLSRYPTLTRCSQMIRREASMTGKEGSQSRDPCCEQYGRIVYDRLPVVRIIFYKGKGTPPAGLSCTCLCYRGCHTHKAEGTAGVCNVTASLQIWRGRFEEWHGRHGWR